MRIVTRQNGSSSAFHFRASSQAQAVRWFFLSLLSFFFLRVPSSRIVTPASFTHSVPSCLSAKKLHLCLNEAALGNNGISSVPLLLAKAKSTRIFFFLVSWFCFLFLYSLSCCVVPLDFKNVFAVGVPAQLLSMSLPLLFFFFFPPFLVFQKLMDLVKRKILQCISWRT